MAEIRNKDRILEAIDQLRRRKARPDIDRICNFVFRRFGVDCKDTLADLQRLVDAEIVIKVEYKGNTSYRNAAKWSKYAMYKNRELRNSSGSTEIHNILSRAFASLLVEDPDYLDIGVPRTELERFMLEDDPLTDLTEIELILTKETSSGFLVKLKNGNYSLADHPVPTTTTAKSTSSVTSNAITLQARGTQQSFSVSTFDRTLKFKPTSPHKEKKPKLEVLAPPVITTATVTTTSPLASTSTTTVLASTSASAWASMTKTPTKLMSKHSPKPSASPAQASGSGKSTELGAINVGGYRVGVRRKTAKKVFDPSDNYTPTRKRGRPAGSGNSSKKEVQSTGAVCCLCSSSSSSSISSGGGGGSSNSSNINNNNNNSSSKDTTRKTTTEKLLQCRDCSNRAHPSCILGKSAGKDKPQLSQWVCHGCKLCAFCFETSENEAMAVCGACGDAYHLTCHSPSIYGQHWDNKWLCSSCDRDKDIYKPSTSKAPQVMTTNPSATVKPKWSIYDDPFFQRFVPKEKTPDPKNWKVDDVCKYLEEHGCAAQAEAFRHHEIDGRSLLLLTRRDVLYELGLKLGPALKVNHFVQLLQKKDIRKVFPFNEMLC